MLHVAHFNDEWLQTLTDGRSRAWFAEKKAEEKREREGKKERKRKKKEGKKERGPESRSTTYIVIAFNAIRAARRGEHCMYVCLPGRRNIIAIMVAAYAPCGHERDRLIPISFRVPCITMGNK